MAKAKTSTAKIGNTTVKGASAADKQAISAAKASVRADATAARTAASTTTRKTQAVQRGDQTPDAKTSPRAKTAAADKLFADADAAARAGFPPDLTREQHENIVRNAALGGAA